MLEVVNVQLQSRLVKPSVTKLLVLCPLLPWHSSSTEIIAGKHLTGLTCLDICHFYWTHQLNFWVYSLQSFKFGHMRLYIYISSFILCWWDFRYFCVVIWHKWCLILVLKAALLFSEAMSPTIDIKTTILIVIHQKSQRYCHPYSLVSVMVKYISYRNSVSSQFSWFCYRWKATLKSE